MDGEKNKKPRAYRCPLPFWPTLARAHTRKHTHKRVNARTHTPRRPLLSMFAHHDDDDDGQTAGAIGRRQQSSSATPPTIRCASVPSSPSVASASLPGPRRGANRPRTRVPPPRRCTAWREISSGDTTAAKHDIAVPLSRAKKKFRVFAPPTTAATEKSDDLFQTFFIRRSACVSVLPVFRVEEY